MWLAGVRPAAEAHFVRHREGPMRHTLVFLAAAVALGVPRHPRQGSIVVGVLEQAQCSDDSSLMVRTLFRNANSAWAPFPSPAAGATFKWTVAFDGHSLGTVTSREPQGSSDKAWKYPGDHLQQLERPVLAPHLANRRHQFAGWCGAPSLRPLVVVSEPNVGDPERWRPYTPDSTERRALFPYFRKVADTVYQCASIDAQAKRWQYRDRDLRFERSYISSTGRKLIALGFNPAAYRCDGPPGPDWTAHWFYVATDTVYLGAEMELVDAGDYDRDGASEVLFWYSGYNEDGYTLFWDSFRRHVDFHWHYN